MVYIVHPTFSVLNDSKYPWMACFEPVYVPEKGTPALPAVLEVTAMLPLLFSSIWGRTVLQHNYNIDKPFL